MLFGKISKIITLALYALTLWTVLLGFSQFGVGIDMNGKTINCPLAGHSIAICQMNPMEHIREWQSMFTMLPAQNMLFAIFALFAFLFTHKLHLKFSIPESPLAFPNNRLVYAQSFQIFDPLKEAFSSGILNPKSF